MITVLLADDHTIVRKGLKELLENEVDITVADEVDDGRKALEKVTRNNYDVVLLDISMPGRDGLEVLKEIKTVKPRTAVLVLSMHPEDRYAIRAIRAGAAGYLTKKDALNELIRAIRTVAEGRKYIKPTLAEKLALALEANNPEKLHHKLSDREFQVLCLIASGKTVSDIAEELSLSVPSISTYRSRILEKMKMKNNAEIMHYAIKNGLVT